MEDKLIVGGSLMHADKKPDFSGWVTKAGIKCSDGRTITSGAFKHQDKATVPLVWQHNHNDPGNVLGHVLLENRDEGVYGHGFFNETSQAQNAKQLVHHGDIKALSIYANQLLEKAQSVMHGIIREVSLVLAGANPGALIDNIVLKHGEDLVTIDDEAVIYTGLALEHADTTVPNDDDGDGDNDATETVQDIYDGMTEEQKNVVHYMVGAALESAESTDTSTANSTQHSASAADGTNNENKDGIHMSRNVFEQNAGGDAAKTGLNGGPEHKLTHDAMKSIFTDAHRLGSLKEAVETYALQHGIENIDVLFPEARAIEQTPEFLQRRVAWVAGVIAGTRKSPFTRIKSLVADITFEEARARGYIKGNLKKEEFISAQKRLTTPATVYKKQKLDRDDIIDITDFNVVSWLQAEMRLMLDEELARAILLGDGREPDDEDKILDPIGAPQGAGIRSILNDSELYAADINVNLGDGTHPQEIVDAVVRAMRFYKGSGNPVFYTTLPVVTNILLLRDTLGRRIYNTYQDIANEMGVSSIEPVEVMESIPDLLGIVVNLSDYTIGTDQGGEVNFFDFFDIDYNQYKYLLETRCSGALTKVRSALVIKQVLSEDVLVAPAKPTYDSETGHITIVDTDNVTYYRADDNSVVTSAAAVAVPSGSSLKIYATADAGYYLDNSVDNVWTFLNVS